LHKSRSFIILNLTKDNSDVLKLNNNINIYFCRSLNQRFRNRNTGAYSFQNAFYYLQFADDSLASSGIEGGNDQLASVRASLVTQRKTRR